MKPTLADEFNAEDADIPYVREWNKRPVRHSNVGLTPRKTFRALIYDQFMAISRINLKFVPSITDKFDDAYTDIYALMCGIAKLKYPPKIKVSSTSKNKKKTIRPRHAAMLWNYHDLYISIFIRGVTYDPHHSVYFDTLHKFGYMENGLPAIAKHDRDDISETGIVKFNDFLRELHKEIHSITFQRKVSECQITRDRMLQDMKSFFDWIRISNDAVKIVGVEFFYNRKMPHLPVLPYENPDDPEAISEAQAKSHWKTFIGRVRGRSAFKALAPQSDKPMIFDYFWKRSFGVYRGYSHFCLFIFNEHELVNIDTQIDLLGSIWSQVVGERGLFQPDENCPNKIKRDCRGSYKRDDNEAWNRVYDAIEYFSLYDQLLIVHRVKNSHSFGHTEMPGDKAARRIKSNLRKRQKSKSSTEPSTVFSGRGKPPIINRTENPKNAKNPAILSRSIDLMALHRQAEEMTLMEHRVMTQATERQMQKVNSRRKAAERRLKQTQDTGSFHATDASDNLPETNVVFDRVTGKLKVMDGQVNPANPDQSKSTPEQSD